MPRLPLPPLPARRIVRDARRVIARRPWVYWFAVGALAAWAYAAVGEHTAAADRSRADWDATRPVLVATADLRPGEPLAGAVAVDDWPRALAPPGALSELPDGAVARQHAAAGDPLSTADVTATTGPLALVPDGWVVAPVVESPASGAAAGDRVQVASEGVVLARAARVVGFVDQGMSDPVTLVATPPDVAALLPAAADITLLRLP